MMAAGLVGAAACGEGDPGPGLSPPGTPLAAGLEVPVGTQLVGPVFLRTDRTGLPRAGAGHVAVLQIDGDPFAAWDDLAGQAQDLGLPIPGSGVCAWRRASNLADLPPTPLEWPVAMARPDLADTLDCQAVARGPVPDGDQLMVDMRLWWWAAGAELHVEISESGMDEPPFSYPETEAGPAPAAAADQLPEREPQPSVDVGDPIGRENNCFETGYDQLTLPGGARLVGGGNTPGLYDFAAVLAVDDAEAVLRRLRDQLDGPDKSDGDHGLSEERLADGRTIWALGGGGSTGGGACSMWSSPDGTALIVTTSSD